MEDLEGKLVELIEKFENLAVEIAPEALELGLMVARMAAAQGVVKLAVFIAVAVVFWKICKRNWAKFAAQGYFDCKPETGAPPAIVAIGSGVIWGIFMLVILAQISIWPFIGIFYPEVWIAKQVLGW